MIETKVSRKIGIISKIKTISSCKDFNFSLLLTFAPPPPLRNSDLGIHIRHIQRLRALQDRAIRIITNARYTDSSNPLYFKLSILKSDDLSNYECAKLMHLSSNGRLPLHLNQQLNFKKVSTVHSHSTRQVNAIHIPRFYSAKCHRSFKYIGTKIWNNIPQELKDHPYSKFKITYKKQLIQKCVSSTS